MILVPAKYVLTVMIVSKDLKIWTMPCTIKSRDISSQPGSLSSRWYCFTSFCPAANDWMVRIPVQGQ